MNIESLDKAFELASKFAFPVAVLAGIVLFAPDYIASTIGILDIRRTYRGYVWLTFLFALLIEIGRHAVAMRRVLWRYLFCPIKKLAFPVVDARIGIKQSRMRYHRIRIENRDGNEVIAYQEIDSNGRQRRFVLPNGRRYFPDDGYGASVIGKELHAPNFARIDWKDVFNGKSGSGCWPISER